MVDMTTTTKNERVEFEDRATPYSFRLHIKKNLDVNGNQVHISISPHYAIPALFYVSSEVTKKVGDREETYGGKDFDTNMYDELVNYLRETYNIEPIFPEDFIRKADMVAKEIIAEQKKRISKRGKKQ